MDREKIRKIYGRLMGYLSQTPKDAKDGGVTLRMLKQVNQAIDELNTTSGDNYNDFKMQYDVCPDDPIYEVYDLDEFRFLLGGLIQNVYVAYFPKEQPPFSGPPQSPINISPDQNQTQEQSQVMDIKSKDVRSFVNTILKASNKEILLVSLIGFIVLLLSFSALVNSFDFLDQYGGWKFIIICVFSALYVLAIIILICGRIREEKFSTARDRIEIWLKEKRKYLSFDALRKDLNEPSYTDPFLKKLIKKYPKLFRNSSPIKTRQGLKPGIALTREASQST